VAYALQIAQGLGAAHEKGIVHRDLKPENLLVTNDDRIKILDFGLARMVRESPVAGVDVVGSMATRSMDGVVVGTVGYMAPEQVRGETVDHRADIFSFGAVFYEMLTRRRAFHRDSVPGTLTAILEADPPSWDGNGSTLSLRALRLIHRCLEKRPARGFSPRGSGARACRRGNGHRTDCRRAPRAATAVAFDGARGNRRGARHRGAPAGHAGVATSPPNRYVRRVPAG
jgi:serine/threonine protein kinase